MTVCRAIHKPDWSWPTRLAPFLHRIMFCSGLLREVPYFSTIIMFSQWRQNVLSLYFKVLTLSCLLPPTSIYYILMIMPRVLHIFAPYSPWHNLQQFKYSKKSTVYIFLTGLCGSCFCSVCTVHLVRVRLKMWMGEDSACHYASWDYSKQNKAQWCLSSGH